MKLNNLQLHNFRMFEYLNIEFHDTLTVIVGENSSGKTTILEAVAIAIGTLLYSFDVSVKNGIKSYDAHNKYYRMGSSVDVQPQYPVEIKANGMFDGQKIEWKRSLNSAKGKMTIIDAKELINCSGRYQKRMMEGDQSLILPVVIYYGTGRLWDYHREKKNDTYKESNRSNGYIDCLDQATNIKLMMSWFRKMAIKDSKGVRPSPEYKAVREAMERCFSLMTGYRKVHIDLGEDTGEIEVTYYVDENNVAKLPLSQLSDGYKGTLSLIADIAYRMAVLNPALEDKILTETDGIVLIDEIDLHLHPKWQQRILNDLTTIFPNIQFIVTTHAPAVINTVNSDNLLILKDGQAQELSSEVYGKEVNSVLNEIMGASERPEELKTLFTEFYEMMDKKSFDQAEKILNKIDELRGYHDPEVASCRIKLKFERIRGN